MKNPERVQILWGATALAALAALALSAHSFSLARRTADDQALAVRALRADIELLTSRMTSAARPTLHTTKPPVSPLISAQKAAQAGGSAEDLTTPAPLPPGAPTQPVVSDDVAALAETVAGMDPDFLRSMHAEYTQRKAVQEYRRKAMEINADQRRADAAKYDGEKLAGLYDEAISTQNRNRDTALASMLTEFPDANVTGMALAERALEAAMSTDTVAVESYYKALSLNDNFSELVTDMGIEAVPTLQKYLIGQYLQEGRYEEASALVDALEKTYADSYVAERGQGGDPEWMPVSQVVQNLRQEVSSAASGQGVGSTGGPGSSAPQSAGGGGASSGTGFRAAGSTPGGPPR